MRYGNSTPSNCPKPVPRVTMNEVARNLKIPNVDAAWWLERSYFDNLTKSQKPQETQVTWRNITNEEIEFLISQTNQRIWANLSIEKRCVMFHRTYPNRRIGVSVVQRIYKMFGLKRKKIVVQSIPARIEERHGEFMETTLSLDDKLHQLDKEGAHIVMLDEYVFKSRDFKRQAWSNIGVNLTVLDCTQKQPCQAVSIAICSCHGVLAQTQVDYSITSNVFEQMLESIRDAAPGNEAVHLFMDNAGYHKTSDVKKKMAEMNIIPIWNVPYKF